MRAAGARAASLTDQARAEHDLLLLCAGGTLDDRRRENLRQLASRDLDWNVIVGTAKKHGVAQLVYHHLAQSGVFSRGDPRLAPLCARAFATTANSVLLARELVDVLARFEQASIAAVPYKGPLLAVSLYRSLALRECTDLDVLVRPDELLRAREVLVLSGYEPELGLTRTQERDLIRTGVEYRLRFDRPIRAGRLAFELHWRIPATFPLDNRALWQRLQSSMLLDRRLPQFAPEDLLLILCVHGLYHAWNTLKWISDIAQLVERYPDLNWQVALDQARRVGGSRVLLLGCAVARAVLGTTLPTDVVRRIDANSAVSSAAEHFAAHLFGRPLRRVGVINQLRMLERAPDRIRYGLRLLGHLTVPTVVERAAWSGPRGAGFVHYLAHPFRMAGRVVREYRA